MTGQPWHILFCGTDEQCDAAMTVCREAREPIELIPCPEPAKPADLVRPPGGDPIEAVIVTQDWLATMPPAALDGFLTADDALGVVVETDAPFSFPESPAGRAGAVAAGDHGHALQLAAAYARACRTDRDRTKLLIELGSTHRAARMVSTEYQRRHSQQEQLFETALNNMSQGLCMFDRDGKLLVANERYLEMYKLPRDVVTPGTYLRDLLLYRKESGNFRSDPDQYCADLRASIVKGEVHTQLIQSGDGRTISLVNRPMINGGWVATHEDITERTRAEEKIRHMARHDSLTGLPNRMALQDEMEKALRRVRRGDSLAVLCLDLDNFKNVNDTLGHLIGDKLLCAVTERLRALIRDTDAVARLGGDEFAILQMGLDRPEQAGAFAQRVIQTISEPYDVDGHHVIVSTSVGIALAPHDGTTTEQLLRHADMALYRSKSDGRAIFRYFEPEMNARLQARRLLEIDLRNAVGRGEFELYYQPQVDAGTEEITGCEALLRWNSPTRGQVSPSDFIPLAEEIGLIVPIGAWVLEQACLEAAAWPESIKVAVNLSPAQFKSKQLIDTVIKALAKSRLDPRRLELEITESVLLTDNEATLSTLHQLRAYGINISMDDFGTGYSSLSYLRSFPFDKIKIDRSFVNDMSPTGHCAAIIKAVAGLGKGLGIRTTAEGVETQAQLEQLRAEGCTEIQGYLFSPPQPAHATREFIARHSDRRRVA